MIDDLRKDLIADEGLRLKPYRCTAGKLTIGVGRNLDDVGITREEAMHLLDEDIARVQRDLDRNVPWWRDMPEPAQRALANMCFNLGWPRLSGFLCMFGALQAGHFNRAADEALDSLWADQMDGRVDGIDGARAERIAKLFRECA